VILRCTAKALDLLGGRRLELTESTPTDDDWYLNLLWVDRKKCLLLAHAGTSERPLALAPPRTPELAPPAVGFSVC